MLPLIYMNRILVTSGYQSTMYYNQLISSMYFRMITPKFTVAQDEEFLTLTLHVPYLKITEMEMFIEGTQFKFYLKPYYLRLTFSHELVENGQEKAQYSVDTGDLVMKLPKATKGQHFEDLTMISKLLASKPAQVASGGIEVLSSEVGEDGEDGEDDECSDEEFNWEIEQTELSPIVSSIKYGFANQHSEIFGRLLPEYTYVIDLKEPETCSPAERKELCAADCAQSFDIQHYIADTVDDTLINDIIAYSPWYRSPAQSSSTKCLSSEQGLTDSLSDLTIHSIDQFTEEERDLLMSLPRKPLLLDKADHQLALLGIVDILYGYCYDHRITYGEACVESPWNICKLSTQLSWLSAPTSLHQSIVQSYTRALTYPLFRNYNLAHTVFEDVITILSKGRHAVLRCFLSIYDILRKHDYYYLLNIAYLQDYCIWLQSIKENKIERLHGAVRRVSVSKADLATLNLVELEELVMQFESSEEYSSSEYSESEESDSESESSESSEGLAPEEEDEMVAGINIKDLTFNRSVDDVLTVSDHGVDGEDKENLNYIAAHEIANEKSGKVLIEEISSQEAGG